MRILLLSQWFEPETAFKGLKFAQALREAGHHVEVLTGFPNYPGGKVYAGYRVRPYQREVMDGIVVHRVALYPSHDRSGLKRALNYLSFAFTASVAAPLLRRPDVTYVYHPPATVAIPALWLKLLRRVPVVYDIQDLWPDTLAATGMMGQPRVLGAVGRFMRGVYRRVDRITVLSDGFRERLLTLGVPGAKVQVIANWTMEDQQGADQQAGPQTDPAFPERFNVLFAGTMGKAQALETVLEAARQLQSLDPAVQFTFVGGGIDRPELEQRARDLNLSNVTFLARRAPADMPEVYRDAQALLVHLKRDPLFEITIPSKTQAYLLIGKPILMGVRGDAARLVQRAGAGVNFEPEDPEALVRAVQDLRARPEAELRRMGEDGRAFYWQHLSLRVGVQAFLNAFAAAREARAPRMGRDDIRQQESSE